MLWGQFMSTGQWRLVDDLAISKVRTSTSMHAAMAKRIEFLLLKTFFFFRQDCLIGLAVLYSTNYRVE